MFAVVNIVPSSIDSIFYEHNVSIEIQIKKYSKPIKLRYFMYMSSQHNMITQKLTHKAVVYKKKNSSVAFSSHSSSNTHSFLSLRKKPGLHQQAGRLHILEHGCGCPLSEHFLSHALPHGFSNSLGPHWYARKNTILMHFGCQNGIRR